MRNRTRLRRNSALLMLGWCASSFASDFISIGPIERISTAQAQVTVLGQAYQLTAATGLDGLQRFERPSATLPQDLEVGDHALVIGRVDAVGHLVATEFRRLPDRYVPGSTHVYVRGKILTVDFATGTVEIGSAVVQVTAVANLPASKLAPGVEVEVVGTQPQPSGAVLALALIVVSNGPTQELQSVTGTGKTSVTGTGKQSVTGTGIQSVTGTGTLSVTGTGKQSVTGTGSLSVTGTGKQSVTGTGKHSVTGTGIQSVTGTGALSVTGTGKQSVTGTGALSVTGTGKQSVTGTGSLSVTGTGKQSVTGTGSL